MKIASGIWTKTLVLSASLIAYTSCGNDLNGSATSSSEKISSSSFASSTQNSSVAESSSDKVSSATETSAETISSEASSSSETVSSEASSSSETMSSMESSSEAISSGESSSAITTELSSSEQSLAYGQFTDSRDLKIYKTIVIGAQNWMAENLKYNALGTSVCYDNLESNCDVYGFLYDWATAMNIDHLYDTTFRNGSDSIHQGICPDGWHVPSDKEWLQLIDYVDNHNDLDDVGTSLRLASAWPHNNATNAFGFSAIPAGFGVDYDGSFLHLDDESNYISASEELYFDYMGYSIVGGNDAVQRMMANKKFKRSLRCIEDL